MSKKPRTIPNKANRAKKARLSKKQIIFLAVLCVFVVLLAIFYPELAGLWMPKPSGDSMTVHFLDVGQGDCTIIQFPDGKTMIVDASENKKETTQKILNYISAKIKIQYFDYAILTHPDSDHSGGMNDVLQNYPAKTVYRPNLISSYSNYDDPALLLTQDGSADDNLKFWSGDGPGTGDVYSISTKVYRDFLIEAYKPFTLDGKQYTPKVIISDGRRDEQRPSGKASQDIYGSGPTSGTYSVEFYAPLLPNYGTRSSPAPNDYSNIMFITYQDITFLLSGDAEKEAEEVFVDAYADFPFDVDVIKAGHHGSRTSSSARFLETVSNPLKRSQIYVVISCGAGNSYGHPHNEALARYTALGFSSQNFLRTDTMGDIVFTVKQDASGRFKLFLGGQTDGTANQNFAASAGLAWVAVLFIEISPDSKKYMAA